MHDASRILRKVAKSPAAHLLCLSTLPARLGVGTVLHIGRSMYVLERLSTTNLNEAFGSMF